MKAKNNAREKAPPLRPDMAGRSADGIVRHGRRRLPPPDRMRHVMFLWYFILFEMSSNADGPLDVLLRPEASTVVVSRDDSRRTGGAQTGVTS